MSKDYSILDELTSKTQELHRAIFDKGYTAGYKQGIIDNNGNAKREANARHEQGYKEGLEDAWQYMKKIAFNETEGGIPLAEIKEMFGEDSRFLTEVLRNYSVTEVIDRIKEYEMRQYAEKQKQVSDDVKIKAGDEVVFPNFRKAIVIHAHTTKFGDTICYGRFDDGKYGEFLSVSAQLTGKHFDNLDEVLKSVGG